jgi:hypothetical protein
MGRFLGDLKNGKDPITVVIDADEYINNIEESYIKNNNHVQSLVGTIQDMLLYSFRYALGRSTYCVQDVCVAISKHKDILRGNTLDVIKREIREYLDESPIGFTREWVELIKELEDDPKGYSASTLKALK